MTTRKPKLAPPVALLLASLCFFLTINATSQVSPKNTAVIFGTVWGPDDRPLPGMVVKIRLAGEKKARWQVRSNRRGEFDQVVPAGKQEYIIWADTKSYKLPDHKHLQPSPEVTVRVERADIA
jgi:hypothetical protein